MALVPEAILEKLEPMQLHLFRSSSVQTSLLFLLPIGQGCQKHKKPQTDAIEMTRMTVKSWAECKTPLSPLPVQMELKLHVYTRSKCGIQGWHKKQGDKIGMACSAH